MEKSIELNRLSIGYRTKTGTRVVVSDIDADLQSGQLTALLGVNGVGKSTLMRTMAGFMKPLAGTIRLLDRPLEDYSESEVAKRIGVVLTDNCRIAGMTAGELVALGRSPYTGFWGRLQKRDRQLVTEAIERVGIGPLINRELTTLSDGERQKVVIAKALAQETPIIFLDEPTAFLDYPSKMDLLRLLYSLAHDTGRTIFLSTHDLDAILPMADHVWLLDRERPFCQGSPVSLLPAFHTYFGYTDSNNQMVS
ncbi:ABC transporter ATP-binding protein [Porphyromonas loveana]|uniref:ABC transporter ATP-binding protein n=1 Tax=Porphyromonas loveana TaxID=1884669 RepID=UPI0035A0857A